MKEKYFEINGRGYNVRCKAYFNEKSILNKAVIYCTGFAGHKDNNNACIFSEKLLSKHENVIVIVFNWPAHGDDVKKKLVLDDCNAYLSLVIDEIRTRFGIHELYAYAVSFGGYLSLKYISENGNPFRRIALRCPAIDMYDVLTKTIMKDDEYGRIMKGKDVEVGFDRKVVITKELLESLKNNDIRQRDYLAFAEDILMFHGTKDEVVPYESGKRFADDNVIELVTVENADHRFQDPAQMAMVNKKVMEFFGL